MSTRITIAVSLEGMTVGDLRAVIKFADAHGIDDSQEVFLDSNPEYPHEAYGLEVHAWGTDG